MDSSPLTLVETTVEPTDYGTSASPPTSSVRLWLRNRLGSQRALLAARGGAWTAAGYVSTQVLRTVTTLILARHFLGPEPFGVVGLVGVFLAGLSMFSDLGI